MKASTWSQRMSLMTLNRSARTFRMAALPWTRRLSASGPRAIRKVASSARDDMIRSTSRLWKAALISFLGAGVGPVVMASVLRPTLYRIAAVPWGGARPGGRRPRGGPRRLALGREPVYDLATGRAVTDHGKGARHERSPGLR